MTRLVKNTATYKLPLFASIFAVALWSLKPILISLIDGTIGYTEAYLISGFISVVFGFVIMGIRKDTNFIFRPDSTIWKAIGWSLVSGFFLGMWYYGFYRALYGANKADATIISFTWPLISIIAIRVFTPQTAPKLNMKQWGLVLLSMIGAIIISTAGETGVGESNANELKWAFIASLGSGLYLPFAIKASNALQQMPRKPSAISSTFFSISFANLGSFITVLSSVIISTKTLNFDNLTLQVIIVCFIIGLGTYLCAEVAWTWAFQEYKSLKLSALPYFSPVVSVILLWLIFGEHISAISLLGMIVILGSNLALHKTKNGSS